MTRKDYELIADAIYTAVAVYGNDKTMQTLEGVALEIAANLKQDNPNFKARKFLDACHIPTNVKD